MTQIFFQAVCEKSLLDSKQFLFGTKCITDFTVDPGPHFLVRPGPTFVNRDLMPDATEGFPSAVLRVFDLLADVSSRAAGSAVFDHHSVHDCLHPLSGSSFNILS